MIKVIAFWVIVGFAVSVRADSEIIGIGNPTPSFFIQVQDGPDEIFRIEDDGKIYWRGRLIESDEDFKASMIDLLQFFKGMADPCTKKELKL